MNILSRYIARTYLKFWLLCLLALVSLVIVANLFGNLDSVFTSRQALLAFLDDTLRSLPAMLDLMIPMTVLLATLFTFNSLGRYSELVAMQSVGMGFFRQLRPIFGVLILVSALDYANQNYLHRLLQRAEFTATAPSQTHQWTTQRDQIVYARRIDARHRRIDDAMIFRWSEAPFRLESLQRAKAVDRADGGAGHPGASQAGDAPQQDSNPAPWRLHNVVSRTLTADGWTLQRHALEERQPEQFPDLFQRDAPDAHHMPLFELSARIRQLESLGQRVEVYRLEWYQKTAALLAPFALVWFGMPLSQAFFRSGRASGEIMLGILGGLLFLIATEIVFTLGKGGYLPPLVAAWAVNVVYFAVGTALMLRPR